MIGSDWCSPILEPLFICCGYGYIAVFMLCDERNKNFLLFVVYVAN